MNPTTTSDSTYLALVALACATLAACAGADTSAGDDVVTPPPATTNAALTYYEGIKPVVDAKCAVCHVNGGIAPFPLDTYDAVKAYAAAMKAAVQVKSMPPWLADSSCRSYKHNFSLSSAEIDRIVAFADAGAPAGDPAREAAALTPPPTELPRVDVMTGMTEAYTPDPEPGELDDFRCFLADIPITSEEYVTGIDVTPSNLLVAHHLVATLVPPEGVAALEQQDAEEAGPGWKCGSGNMGIEVGGGRPGNGGNGDLFDRMQGQGLLSGWVPGARPNVLPAGTGMLVRPGSKIMMNMHYNVLASGPNPGPDQTTIRLMLEDSVEKPGISMFWTNPTWIGQRGGMIIPPNESDVVHTFAFDPTQFISGGAPLTVHSAMLHMHTFGSGGGLAIERQSGGDECLLDIPRWDFGWQMTYGFTESTVIQPGDKLRIECHYDNSAANQPIVAGEQIEPQEVRWGEGGTLDEMCLGALFFTR